MRSPFRRGITAGAACVLLGLLPGTAGAATYEQLSRATGVYGGASIADPSTAGPVSDTGIFGLYGQVDGAGAHSSLRNIYTNRTSPIEPSGRVFAIDAAEKVGLAASESNGATRFTVGPLTGGATQAVATVAGGSAALSGDGQHVAVAGTTGATSLFDVATGTSSVLWPTPLRLSRYSISDDGSVVAGATTGGASPGGLVLTGGTGTPTPYPASISPNGHIAFWVDTAKRTLVARSLADGAERTLAIPPDLGDRPQIIWIDPDGRRVALSASSTSVDGTTTAPTALAQVVTVPLASWARFGGAYSRFLYDPVTGTAGGNFSISRNGRFATLGFNRQVALVTLESNLPGAGDAISASSYFGGAGAVRCGATTSFSGYLAQPAPWLPKPQSGTATVVADGAVVREVSSERAQLPATAFDDPAFAVTIPATAKTVTVTWTVIDSNGNTLRETYPLQTC